MPSLVNLTCLVLVAALALVSGQLVGCQSAPPPQPSPVPTLPVLTVQHTPALRPWRERLANCAEEISTISLVVQELPAPALDLTRADLALRLGPDTGGAAYATQIGQANFHWLADADTPPSNLSAADLPALYGPTGRGWGYLAGDDLAATLLASFPSSPTPPIERQAPDPDALQAALLADPLATGPVPEYWPVAEGIQVLKAAPDLQISAPVLALAQAEPQGAARLLVGCLQAE